VGSLLKHQVDKSEESVANCLVGAAVRLFVGGKKGSQMGVGAVVTSAIETVAGMVCWWCRSGGWRGSGDAAIMLGRKGCLGTTIAGNNRVIINVIVIVCQDLEGVVMLC
jgi:hypothetical protein